jgi:DNA gyrase/topoisomerase IV subunit A
MSEESKDQKDEGENCDQTKPVKGPLASKDDEEITVERTQKDVLWGRGVQVLHHVGNLRLHLAANEFREEYLRSRRNRKKEIIESIVIAMRADGSRFLRCSKRDKKKWVEAGDGFAYDKVSHVLRGQNTGKAIRKMKDQGRCLQNNSNGQPHTALPQVPLQPAGGIAPRDIDNLTTAGANVPHVQALSNASLASNLNPNTLPGLQLQNNLRAGHNTTPFPPQANMSLLLQQSNLFGNPTGVNIAELAAAANSVVASTMTDPNMNPRALYLAKQMNPGLPLPQQTYNFMSRAQMNPPMAAAAQQLAANNSAKTNLTAILNRASR